jgi:enoyl-CoA hydratase/carnithine racemase
MSSELLTERRAATLVLTVSDPASRNTLSAQACAAGIEALSVAESDPSVQTIVLRGDGHHFCAGSHLQRVQPGVIDDLEASAEALQRFNDFTAALQVCPKPVIAAVEGLAAGGGFALALACDLIVAAADAQFVLPNAANGLAPEGGITWQLMQRVPRALALEWLWLGAPVAVERLQSLGIVNRVAGSGLALDQALHLAAQLGTVAPDATARVKELVNQCPGHSLLQQAALERDYLLQSLRGLDGEESVGAAPVPPA